jgi:hypothetical protein
MRRFGWLQCITAICLLLGIAEISRGIATVSHGDVTESPGNDTYIAPNLTGDIFNGEPSISAKEKYELATALAGMVQNRLFPAHPQAFDSATKILGIALRLDPSNYLAQAVERDLESGVIPAVFKKNQSFVLVRKTANALKKSDFLPDRTLAAYLYATIGMVDSNDPANGQLAAMEKAGITLTWGWAEDIDDDPSQVTYNLPVDTASADKAAAQQTPIKEDCIAAVGALLQASDGKLTPQVREAYLDWAQRSVLQELQQSNVAVPESCLSEVLANDTLRDAMFGAVFPPDPSILQNYARLRSEMGPEFMNKYGSLVVAVAVADRIKGVEVGKDPLEPVANTPDTPKGQKAEQLVAAIVNFLQTNQITALELYQNPAQQQQLATYLQQHNIDPTPITQVPQFAHLGELLKQAMVILGERPAARDTNPDEAAWLRYLVSIYESTPSSTPILKKGGMPMSWPLFPISNAPWPLLMPLSRPIPLKEANYIWEKFLGVYGPNDRFHTYGPYRHAAVSIFYELQPSSWNWDSWPDRIVHGGLCVIMSVDTVDTYSVLCRPSVYAGQPGHANLISFQWAAPDWTAQIEQAYAGGPDVTYAQWYFNQELGTGLRFRYSTIGAGAEYDLGLALGMNLGLKSYMDTRIAANLYLALPPAEQKTLGVNLLLNALQINPFNPDIWYRLARQTTNAMQGMMLAKAAMNHDPGGLEDEPNNVNLEEFIEPEHSKPANTAMIQYWRTVEEFVTRFGILDHPVPQDEQDAYAVYTFLQGVPGITTNDLAPYAARFRN